MRAFACIPLVLLLSSPGPLSSDDLTGKQIAENRAMLDAQKSLDEKQRKEILLKLDSFLLGINGITEKENGVRLTSPLAPDEIRGIEPVTHDHSGEKPAEAPLAAYITGSGVRMRTSDGSGSEITARLDFGEKVGLLAKSEKSETINGRACPWILVRRSDGSEGWVFGAYIGKKDPRHRADETKTGGSENEAGFDLPSAGMVTSTFGHRVDPVTGRKGAFHSGIDIAAPSGTMVKAAANGTVRECGFYHNVYGNLVVIEHGKNLCTYYGHLSRIGVKKGDRVTRGDIIGKVGSSGKATGAHLHFEVRKGASALDPRAYLR